MRVHQNSFVSNKAKKMRHLVILGLLLLAVAYMLLNPMREHLTAGPPTLGSLQSDVKGVDSKLNKLEKEFEDMKKQASEGANAAAAARLQVAAIKNTGGSPYPTAKLGK
jgi:hypothetical protein